jgi:hypothetical protein
MSQSFSEIEKFAATTGKRLPSETRILTRSDATGFPSTDARYSSSSAVGASNSRPLRIAGTARYSTPTHTRSRFVACAGYASVPGDWSPLEWALRT